MTLVLDLGSPAFLEDPYPMYARLRQEAPVYRHPAGFYLLSRHVDVSHALRHPEVFSSAAMGGQVRPGEELEPARGSVISLDPPAHTEQRRIVSRGFTPRRIAAFEPRVRAVAERFFAGLVGRVTCDLTGDLANPIPVSVIAELLGLDPARRDDFKRWSTTVVIGSTTAGAVPGAAQKADLREFRDFMLDTIERRRAEPGDDLVSLLVHAEEQGGILSADQVFAFATLLLIAGSETTTNLIGNAVLALLGQPGVRARVESDPGLVPRWIEETLRWDSPVQMVMRLCRRDVELEGGKLPAGALVFLALASANRDPAQFAEPDRFELDRDPTGHLAFGQGHHFCLGASLARLEARVVLERIVARMPGFRPSVPGAERHGSFLIRGPRSLPVEVPSGIAASS